MFQILISNNLYDITYMASKCFQLYIIITLFCWFIATSIFEIFCLTSYKDMFSTDVLLWHKITASAFQVSIFFLEIHACKYVCSFLGVF